MGLYLCIFAGLEDDEEVDGLEAGSYDDFHVFRNAVASHLEGGDWGKRFPILMSHPDSDGEWTPEESSRLAAELLTIKNEFTALPAQAFVPGSWQDATARSIGLKPGSLADCFIDVDGESLIDRLGNLAELAVSCSRPISFQ